MADRTTEDATRVDEIFALPAGAQPDDLPAEPADWFGLDESIAFALRRATASLAAPAETPAPAPPASHGDPDEDDLVLSGLGEGLLAALAGLHGDGAAGDGAMIGDLPAPGVDHPLSALATLVRQLEGLGLGGVRPEAHADSTRRLCWSIRMAAALCDSHEAARERRMRFVFDAVGQWLRGMLGERAGLLDDADRLVAVPGVSLTLLGIFERQRALELRLVAAAVLRLSGRLDAGQTRREVARALLDAPESARLARERTAVSLGATEVDVALARLSGGGSGGLESARALLRDVSVATDAAWGQLLERVVERLEADARHDEATELVLEVGDVAETPTRALAVLTRPGLTGAQRERAAEIVAAHGGPGLGDASAWLSARVAAAAARAALDAGQPAEALRALRRAGDDDDEAMRLAARAHEALGQVERAAARYERLAAAASVAPQDYAGLGRTGLALGRRDAAELLELAFQSGYTSAADARLLVEHHVGSGELVAAERWLEVATELAPGASHVALHEGLSAVALEQGRAMAASGDVGQAEGLLALAARHAGRSAGQVALARLEVAERARGRSAALEAAAALDATTAESVARAALRALRAQTTGEAAERAIELADALRTRSPRAVWPFVLLAPALELAEQPDAAISAAEGGLMQCSGQIAADEPGGEPAPLSGRLARQRDDAASLYALMSEVHRARGDRAAACQVAARGLAHLGRVEQLVELAGRLLASGDGHEVRMWEMAMMSVLGPAGVAPLVDALRARAVEPEPTPLSPEHGDEVVSQDGSVVARALEAIGVGGEHAARGLSGALGDARGEALASLGPGRAVVIVSGWLESPPASSALTSSAPGGARVAVVGGGGREGGPLASSPGTAPAWTVQPIDKASSAFGPGGEGEGSSS